MAKKKRIKQQNFTIERDEVTISEKTEQKYKNILRSMSWIVGICFTLIIILPLFNNQTLDSLTRIFFFIGILNLFIFTLLEFIGDAIKRQLEKMNGVAK